MHKNQERVKQFWLLQREVTAVIPECHNLFQRPILHISHSDLLHAAACYTIHISKIWGFHGGDYEECHLLGYKNPVRTSQETHYVSTTEPSQLMLCKSWGFHGSDCEEYCFLGYKNLVHTLQETHYVSTKKPSQLMLCKIWGFHGGDYEEWRLLGCYTAWLL
jgi:hypothetical protein